MRLQEITRKRGACCHKCLVLASFFLVQKQDFEDNNL